MLATVSRHRRVDLEPAVRGQRALEEQLHGGALRSVTPAVSPAGSGSGSTSKTCSPRMSQRRPARRQHPHPRRVSDRRSAISARRRHQVLEVVDDQQQLAVAEVAHQPVRARTLAGVPLGQRARDLTSDQRRVGQLLEADEHGRRRRTPRARAAPSSSSSRVLPTPPGPVSVTSWTSGSAIRPASCRQLPSRPTSRVSARGRFDGGARRRRRWRCGARVGPRVQRLGRGRESAAAAATSGSPGSSPSSPRTAVAPAVTPRVHPPGGRLGNSASISCPESRSSNRCSATSCSSSGTSSPAAPPREVSVEPQHDRLQSLLVEGPAPLRHASLRGDVGKRLAAEQAAAPHSAATPRARARLGPARRARRNARRRAQSPGRERVARRPEDEQPAEQPAQLRQVHVQAPTRRWPAGALPRARRSADRVRSPRRRPSAAAPAAIADGRSGSGTAVRPARAPAGQAPRNDTRRRPPCAESIRPPKGRKSRALAVLWCALGARRSSCTASAPPSPRRGQRRGSLEQSAPPAGTGSEGTAGARARRARDRGQRPADRGQHRSRLRPGPRVRVHRAGLDSEAGGVTRRPAGRRSGRRSSRS